MELKQTPDTVTLCSQATWTSMMIDPAAAARRELETVWGNFIANGIWGAHVRLDPDMA